MGDDTDALAIDAAVQDLAKNVALDPALGEPVNASAVATTPAQRISEADAKVREHEAMQVAQNTLWRRILFWGVSTIVAFVVVLDAWAIITYLFAVGSIPDPIVMSTWFVASVAQIVGLLLIITRHLFPGESKSK